jgi:hypothetical protein
MNRKATVVFLLCVGAIAVVALAGWAWLFNLQRRSVEREERLVRETTQSRWPSSEAGLLQAVQGLARIEGSDAASYPCPSPSLIYGASVSNRAYDFLHRFTSLHLPGIRPSKASAFFCVWPSGGNAYFSNLDFSFTRNSDATPVTVNFQEFPSTLGFPAFEAQVTSGGTLRYSARVPIGYSSERARALDLDLSCAARFRGCSGGRAVIRSAWPDYERRALLSKTQLPE